MKWPRIWALTIKELLMLLRDKRGRFVVITPPLLQLLVFGYASTYDLNNIPYAIYNEDPGFASRELLGRFQGAPIFQQVATINSNNQMPALINEQKVLLVVHIDGHFTRDLLLHHPAKMQVIIDGRNSNTATIALNYVSSILLGFNEFWAAKYQWGKPPAQLEIRSWFNPNLLSIWFIVPGIIALLMQVVTLIVIGLSVAREREQGTFDQLLVTPLSMTEILIGKALPGVIISGLEGILITIVAVVWFQVPFVGSVSALGLGMLLFLLAVIGIGLSISAIAATQQQGLLGVFMFMVPSIILSGYATPIENMPPLIQDLTYLNPLRYFLVITRGVCLEGYHINNLWSQYWPLAVMAIFTLTTATWLFRARS